jgi:hypothetical protein
MKLLFLVHLFSNLRVFAIFTAARPHMFFNGRHSGIAGLLFVLAAIALIFLLVRLLATGEKSQ